MAAKRPIFVAPPRVDRRTATAYRALSQWIQEFRVMAKQPGVKINEKALNKGQMRKLTTLRKSLGNEIGDKAFAAWLDQADSAKGASMVDQNAKLITDVLGELVNAGKLRIPRGGYHIARGRRRVIITRP